MATRKPTSKAAAKPTKAKSAKPAAAKPKPAASKPMKASPRAAAKTPPASAKTPKTVTARQNPKQTGAAANQPSGDSKTGASVLGEVVWLMSQSKTHLAITAGDLNSRLLPAINHGQVRVFQANDKLIGAAIWAFVSEAVEQRLSQNNPQLEPGDWTSGETVWLVDLIAPFGAEKTMLEEMKETLFPDRVIKFRGVKDGKATIYSL